ncbi:Hypothetical predicted protein [Mytilus galloprovincialis]|uniref:Uncharacterized protein n=1 Tax=Mytilus galloprovincialis TaxID=29158 RepID=A0A8B6HFU5_MYTGA|nr:Hypothetical predicted protein [Mytilus galloprovincialis]
MILVDHLGNYLNKLDVDSEPYDVSVTNQNISYVTQPNSRTVLQIDPDRMVLLSKVTCNDLHSTVTCVSAVPNTGREYSGKIPCFLGVNKNGMLLRAAVHFDSILTEVPGSYGVIGSRVVKFHAFDEDSYLSIIGGQNYIKYDEKYGYSSKNVHIATIDTPTDICSNDNGHIYVSGQGSNTIHRLVKELPDKMITPILDQNLKVLDIPLGSRHGIKEPVAMCFNYDYSKLYIVNDWGKKVLVFDVI